MRLLAFIAAIFACLVFREPLAASDECGDILKKLAEIGLTPKQAEKVAEAQGSYVIQILSAEVNGTRRVIVLVGEKHVVSDAVGKTGDGILSAFPDRAIEGIQPNNFWGGRLFAKALMPISTTSKAGQRVGPAMMAALAPMMGQLTEGLVERTIEEIRAGRKTIADVEASFAPDRDMTKVDLKGLEPTQVTLMQVFAQSVDRKAFLEKVHARLAELGISGDSPQLSLQAPVQPTSSESEPQKEPRVFRLENNYKPTLKENVGSVLAGVGGLVARSWSSKPGIVTGVAGTALAVAVFGTKGLYAIQVPVWTYALGAGAEMAGMHMVVARRTFTRQGPRDIHMANSIVDVLKQNNDVTTLVVNVGANHVRPMTVELTEKNGFKDEHSDYSALLSMLLGGSF